MVFKDKNKTARAKSTDPSSQLFYITCDLPSEEVHLALLRHQKSTEGRQYYSAFSVVIKKSL